MNLNTSNHRLQGQNDSSVTSVFDFRLPRWYVVCLSFISTLTSAGNGFVIVLICTRKRLRRRASPNWFILSLGVADFCVGSFNIPTILIRDHFDKQYGSISSKIVTIGYGIFISASITNLCVLTIDIYLAIVHPFAYAKFMKPSRALMLIFIAWFLPVLQKLPLIISYSVDHFKNEMNYLYEVSRIIMLAFLPSLFMAYAYIRIFFVVRCHRMDIERHEMQVMTNTIESANIPKPRTNKILTNDGTVKAVGIVVVIFIICNGFFQYSSLSYLVSSIHLTPFWYYFVWILKYFNSASNFFVYSVVRMDFSKELRIVVRKYWMAKRSNVS